MLKLDFVIFSPITLHGYRSWKTDLGASEASYFHGRILINHDSYQLDSATKENCYSWIGFLVVGGLYRLCITYYFAPSCRIRVEEGV